MILSAYGLLFVISSGPEGVVAWNFFPGGSREWNTACVFVYSLSRYWFLAGPGGEAIGYESLLIHAVTPGAEQHDILNMNNTYLPTKYILQLEVNISVFDLGLVGA